MKLELEFGTCLCYCAVFKINGIDADSRDFGEKFDRSPETAKGCACGDMRFTDNPSTKKLLDKYSITEDEYGEIVRKLEEGLSFGRCGWCV